MSKQYSHSITRRLTIMATLTLLGFGAMIPVPQAAEGTARPGTGTNLLLAATDGMDRRQDRREDRQDDRGDRQDVRQDCREEEGVAGKDKRDCKQEGREERRDDNNK
jgi:hypothetical protein